MKIEPLTKQIVACETKFKDLVTQQANLKKTLTTQLDAVSKLVKSKE